MNKKILSGLSVLVFLAVLAVSPFAVASPNRIFTTHLIGAEQNPPVQTLGQGEAIFMISKDGQSIHYMVIAANIENITQSHIHVGPRGVNGPIVVWLYPASPPAVLIPGRFNGVLAEGEITAANLVGQLAGHPLSDLINAMRAGNTYVNVHTSQNPMGEIRGQI